MSIAAFPTPALGGEQYLKLRDLDPDWEEVTTEQVMDDGGADYNLEADSPILVWELFYDGLLESQARLFDDHRALAKGKSQDFTFTHPRTGVVYTGVRYADYQRDHLNYWTIQSRRIRLIKRP